MKTINIVTALNCEAKPLIDCYVLAKIFSRPFDLYCAVVLLKEEIQVKINLVVGGIGALNTATASGWLAGRNLDKSRSAWLNLGVAGHKSIAVGEILRVCNVLEPASSYTHYPSLTAKWGGKAGVLLTSDKPITDYPNDTLVDMEGASFFIAASIFSSSELVQSLKIVSDNQEVSMARLNASIISDLVANQINPIQNFVEDMLKLLPSETAIENPSSLIAHLHSTVSQRQQFIEVVEKLNSLDSFTESIRAEVTTASSLKELLVILKQNLSSINPSLSQMVSGSDFG